MYLLIDVGYLLNNIFFMVIYGFYYISVIRI